MFGGSVSMLMEFVLEQLGGLLRMIMNSYGLGLFDHVAFEILVVMSFLEAAVDVFGDLWGITGAFLCIEGMGEVFVGIEGGLCLVYHPDLGWAAYIYGGIIVGPMIGGGAIIAGFWTWHSKKPFEFSDWTRWFYGPEGMLGLGYLSSKSSVQCTLNLFIIVRFPIKMS